MRVLLLALASTALLLPIHARSGAASGVIAARAPLSDGSAPAGQATPSGTLVQGVFGSPSTFATRAQLAGYGFSFGPSDGAFGAIPAGNVSYTFYGAAGSTSTCAGSPNARNGAFTFTGTLDQVTGSNGCRRLFGPGDGPSGWVFDRDYAGGGQVVPFAAGGQSGWLMPFHAELQWQNPTSANHRCGVGSGVPCFYGSIGLAVSTDGGQTFHVAGQILQSGQPLSAFIGGERNLGMGYGSLLVADANGQHVDNPPADPSSAYFYLIFNDLLPGVLGRSPNAMYMGIARAPYADVVAAALSGNPDQVATLFHKYDGASPNPWTQPATSDTPDESGMAGTFAPLWTDEPGVASNSMTIYDSAFGVYLAISSTGTSFGANVDVRTSTDLIHWSTPIGPPYTEPGRVLYQPTLVGETSDPTIGGPAPRVYFTSFPSGAFPNWSNAVFESVPLLLSPGTSEASP